MEPGIAVIDPGSRVAELDTFNVMSSLSPLPLSYHLPALFGMDSLDMLEPVFHQRHRDTGQLSFGRRQVILANGPEQLADA